MDNSFCFTQHKVYKTLLAQINPSVKILISIIMSLTITALNNLSLLISALAISIFLLFLAKVKVRQLLARFIPLLPFLLPVALLLPILVPGEEVFRIGYFSYSFEGVMHGLSITLRMLSIVFIFTALIASTSRQSLLIGAGKLGIPQVFIQITEFAFRYFEVVFNEGATMLTARKCRGYERSKIFELGEIHQLGSLIGMLFYRSFGRAERIYTAMLSRGYSSDIIVNKKTRLKKTDFILSTGIVVLCIFLLFADRGGLTHWM